MFSRNADELYKAHKRVIIITATNRNVTPLLRRSKDKNKKIYTNESCKHLIMFMIYN